MPRVSIGLPVYNGEKYLRAALDSLLGQDYGDFELIISDNASTDGTAGICQEYVGKDRRIRYHRNDVNVGSARNYNRVFELARGEFFKWASHDDECHPTMLRRCLETFEGGPPSLVLAYPQADIIDASGQVIDRAPDILRIGPGRPHQRLARMLFKVQYGTPLWGLIRSDCLRKTRLMVGCIRNDFVLLAEIAMLGQSEEIPEVLFRLRKHPANATALWRDRRQLLIWCDPTQAKKRLLLPPTLGVILEVFRSIRHLPLPPADKALCLATPLPTLIWRTILRRSGPLRDQVGLHLKKTPGTHAGGAELSAQPRKADGAKQAKSPGPARPQRN